MKKFLHIIGEKGRSAFSGKAASFGSKTKGSRMEGKNSVGRNSSVVNSYLGYGSYVASGSFLRNTKVGRYCCIGKNVRIIDVTHPSRGFVSVHPLFFSEKTVVGDSYVGRQKFEEYLKLPDGSGYSVKIGNDVWIGDGAMILGGHEIGDGAIIAAGAVVTKDVEPYTIVAGVPAHPIRRRFSDEDIDFLRSFRWWEKDEGWLRRHAELFEDITKFREEFEKG